MGDIPFVRLLVSAAQAAVHELNEELSRQGHPGVRPSYGYALLAVGEDGVTTSELAVHLGVTKQAAAKAVDRLVDRGYLTRGPHSHDRRASLLQRTAAADDLLRKSEMIQRELEVSWTGDRSASCRTTLETALADRVDEPLRPVW